MSGPEPELLWSPSAQRVATCRMSQYQRWLADNKNVVTTDYRSLWRWSTTDLNGFWSSIREYFDVLSSTTDSPALVEARMPGAQWFPGARLNWAEILLRHVHADGPAIITLDEDGKRFELG